MTRIYVAQPLAAGGEALLDGPSAAHVGRVLRLQPGAPLVLFDGRGGEYAGEIIEVAKRRVRVRLDAPQDLERESPLPLTLLQCLTRGEKMDLIVQKATELGAARIVPVAAERSVVQLRAADAGRRLQHWSAIAISACEQCGRNRLPRIEAPQPLAEALRAAPHAALRLLLEPQAPRSLAQGVGALDAGASARGIAVLIGPEGGFTEAEGALARSEGFQACRFGPRILRTETAAIAVLAALQVIAGDLR